MAMRRVCLSWIDPCSSRDGQTPDEAFVAGRPMDMHDKAIALFISPQAQQ